MYPSRPGLIIGFHGCDKELCDAVIAGQAELKPSNNDYDWLGHGVYFWENNIARAHQFVEAINANPRNGKPVIKHPAVLGAIIDPGQCLDLLSGGYHDLLMQSFETLKIAAAIANVDLPVNKPTQQSGDLKVLRYLDCKVLELLHKDMDDTRHKFFDSVRGAFWEGNELYRTAGFKDKDHIQICIRNPNCIKGYFLPRKLNESERKV